MRLQTLGIFLLVRIVGPLSLFRDRIDAEKPLSIPKEAGYCSKTVSDRGDWCLFAFEFCCRLFFTEYPFPFCKDQLIIGDWYENRRSAHM